MVGCQATGDADWGVVGGAVLGGVFLACAEGAGFQEDAVDTGVSVELALVTSDRFADVLCDRDRMAEDIDSITCDGVR